MSCNLLPFALIQTASPYFAAGNNRTMFTKTTKKLRASLGAGVKTTKAVAVSGYNFSNQTYPIVGSSGLVEGGF